MNYTTLPPGRRRGIVYANNLLSRQRRRLLNIRTPPLSYIRPSSYILPTRIIPISPIRSFNLWSKRFRSYFNCFSCGYWYKRYCWD